MTEKYCTICAKSTKDLSWHNDTHLNIVHDNLNFCSSRCKERWFQSIERILLSLGSKFDEVELLAEKLETQKLKYIKIYKARGQED